MGSDTFEVQVCERTMTTTYYKVKNNEYEHLNQAVKASALLKIKEILKDKRLLKSEVTSILGDADNWNEYYVR
jgi:hypothetical protein